MFPSCQTSIRPTWWAKFGRRVNLCQAPASTSRSTEMSGWPQPTDTMCCSWSTSSCNHPQEPRSIFGKHIIYQNHIAVVWKSGALRIGDISHWQNHFPWGSGRPWGVIGTISPSALLKWKVDATNKLMQRVIPLNSSFTSMPSLAAVSSVITMQMIVCSLSASPTV